MRWFQTPIRDGDIELESILGNLNPADSLATHPPGPDIPEHMHT